MEKHRKFLPFIVVVFSFACSNNQVDNVANDEVRAKLYSSVLSDHQYMMELLDSIRSNPHASMMLYSDTAILNKMLAKANVEMMLHHIMKRGESDSLSCKKVCMAVMDHSSVMKSMLSEMEDRGVVKKGCRMGMEKDAGPGKGSKKHH